MEGPVMKNESSPDAKTQSQRSLAAYTLLALGLAIVVRVFVAAPYVVSGSSMEPNFHDWNYLIVDRISYGMCPPTIPLVGVTIPCIPVGNPERGDVIVFDLPQEPSRALIKRVIGLPGETIELSGSAPTVTVVNAAHPDGFILQEPYLSSADLGGATNIRVTLNANQYFVLGDNRKVSADSRLWGILPRSDIVGRVFLRLYPPVNIGILPGEARYSD